MREFEIEIKRCSVIIHSCLQTKHFALQNVQFLIPEGRSSAFGGFWTMGGFLDNEGGFWTMVGVSGQWWGFSDNEISVGVSGQ